jgi:C-terminal processing protease CtpA/Prc
MREKSLHLWASLSLALGLILAGSALGQEKSNPPAKAPQPSAKPNTEKPANPPAKNAEQPKSEQPSKPNEKQADKPAEKPKDNATEKAPDRTSPRNTDRSDRDRSDRQPDASRTDRNDRSNADRSTDRSNRDGSSTDRKGTDTANRRNKEVKASDLGFTFDDSDSDKGLKLSKLASKSIGSKADFKEGDIVVSINDHRVRSQRDFLHWIHAGSHDRITVIVLRDDREVTLYLDPAVIFEETTVHSGAWLGVDLNDRFATAAVVLKVHPNSPAQRAGLKGEDVILSVDGQRIQSADHLGEVIGRMEPEQKVEIRLERNQQAEVVDATLGRRENVTRRTSVLPRR